METVRKNHSWMLDPRAQLGVLDGNPCYEDQIEGVSLFAKGRSLFLFNAVLNAKREFLKIFAGHYIQAHKIACQFVDQVYGCVIPKEADLVIASCGGYPKDINVYQTQKTMDNAVCAVRKGGVVILLSECIEGSGSEKLEETFKRLKTAEAIREELEKQGITTAQFIEQAVTTFFEKPKGVSNMATRTLAFQVSEELLQRIKTFLARYEQIYHRKLSQKEFLVHLIERELDEAEKDYEKIMTAQAAEENADTDSQEPDDTEMEVDAQY